MQPVECAVIAAAGIGSRLGHGIPKCMLDIGGATLLGKLVDTLAPLVPRIHVVIGYRGEMIVDLVARQYREVVLVRNPEFRTTNTAQSMSLGARGCSGKVVFLDGDLLVDPSSLQEFVARAAHHDLMIGVADAATENAVYVRTEDVSAGEVRVAGFSRTEKHPLEWANVFAGPARFLDHEENYVFNRLEKHLPAPAFGLNLREVDTVADLVEAKKFHELLAMREAGTLRVAGEDAA